MIGRLLGHARVGTTAKYPHLVRDAEKAAAARIGDIPAYIRSDNGPEFVAEAVRRWIVAVGARTAFIEPGSPWVNGYIESFNARLRDEFLRP